MTLLCITLCISCGRMVTLCTWTRGGIPVCGKAVDKSVDKSVEGLLQFGP